MGRSYAGDGRTQSGACHLGEREWRLADATGATHAWYRLCRLTCVMSHEVKREVSCRGERSCWSNMTGRSELDLQRVEQDTLQRTQRECAEAVNLAKRALDHLNDGLNLMPDKWAVPDAREGLILQLSALGYDSLRWAFEISVKGYYLQAYALIRQGWESWLHAAYLHVYRDRPVDEWRNFRTRPKPTAMRKAVAARSSATGASNDEFAEAMDDIADAYAGFAHPSAESVRLTLGTRGDDLWLRRGGEFDTGHFLRIVNFFCLTAYLLSTMMIILLPEETATDYRRRVDQLHDDLAAWRTEPPPDSTGN